MKGLKKMEEEMTQMIKSMLYIWEEVNLSGSLRVDVIDVVR